MGIMASDKELEIELKAIAKERSRAIRETMKLLKARGVHVDRKVIAESVSLVMMQQRFGSA